MKKIIILASLAIASGLVQASTNVSDPTQLYVTNFSSLNPAVFTCTSTGTQESLATQSWPNFKVVACPGPLLPNSNITIYNSIANAPVYLSCIAGSFVYGTHDFVEVHAGQSGTCPAAPSESQPWNTIIISDRNPN